MSGDIPNITAETINAKTNNLNVTQKKEITKVINQGDYITDGQQKEILALADKLAEYKRLNGRFGKLKEEDGSEEVKKHNAAIVGKSIGACRKIAMKEAKSAGSEGATSTSHIPACDFAHIKKTLEKFIMYEQSGEGAHEHDDFQSDLIKKIQTRRKRNLGTSDEKFKLYLLEEYGTDSLTSLSYDDLRRLKNYTFGKNPTFVSTKKDDAVLAKRVAAFTDWVEYKQATTQGFDKSKTGMFKFQIFYELEHRYPQLFTIAPKTFEDFWKSKGAKEIGVIAKTGKPPASLSKQYDKYILKD